MYDTWKVNKPECWAAPLKNDTDAAQKNKTLVEICDVFVDGCNKNKTVTDAGMFLDFHIWRQSDSIGGV